MGKLLHTEWYKLFHDKVFFITLTAVFVFNAFIFAGFSFLNMPGQKALLEVMKKEIFTAMVSCIYGGLFIGGDFADRTLYHALMTGKSRTSVLFAKSIVFAAATDGLLFFFPFVLAAVCTAKNGWCVSGEKVYHIIGMIAALLIIGFAMSAVSMLAAVCFRDVGRTIGVPIILYFIMILLLNSPCSPAFSKILPVGVIIKVTDGTVSAAYGALIGIMWLVLMTAISAMIFRRAELR